MKWTILMVIIVGLTSWDCTRKEENKQPSDSIKIVSLTSSFNTLMAYDTTVITVHAIGDNLHYGWEANHGNINGSGSAVKYSACISCIGHNTITCRVFNDTGEVSDTIMIRVTPFHTGKK